MAVAKLTKTLVDGLASGALVWDTEVIGLGQTHGRAGAVSFDTVIKPFFAQHCARCHGEKKHEGDLRIDTLVIDFNSPKVMAHWEEIMNRLNSGDMPPEDEPRPRPEDSARVTAWIAGQLHEADVVRQASGTERVSFRKLSREEYANSIRDLLVPAQSELVLEGQTARGALYQPSRALLTVDYVWSPVVAMWVPKTMTERYDNSSRSMFITGVVNYANYRQFGTSARIVQ